MNGNSGGTEILTTVKFMFCVLRLVDTSVRDNVSDKHDEDGDRVSPKDGRLPTSLHAAKTQKNIVIL